MTTETINGVMHQLLLMARDPILYLAIDEDSGGFSTFERLSISVSKAAALNNIYRIDEALELALRLNKTLKEEDMLSLEIINLFTIISIYDKRGDKTCSKSYSDETYIRAKACQDEALRLMASTFEVNAMQQDPAEITRFVEEISERVNSVEHPYYRSCLLTWLGQAYSSLYQYDKALDFFSAAYDLATLHQISICSLKLCLHLVRTCAALRKPEMSENFYNLAEHLIAQLKLPVYDIGLNLNYGMLKAATGDHQGAILFYQKSLNALASSGIDMSPLLFDLYTNLAQSLSLINATKEALHYQLEAEKSVKGKGFTELEISLSAQIATTLMDEERYDEALDRLNKAAEFYRKSSNKADLIKTMRTIGQLYGRRSEFEKGFAIFKDLDELNQLYITHLQQKNSSYSEQNLKQILRDSKTLRAKYDHLMSEVVKRQATRFLGKSTSSKRVIDSAVLASMHREANVLILGENGTGKEVLAQMIHYSSAQKNEAFVTVNCSAISASLFDVEFFGAAACQFTGASEERIGLLEQAAGGTIFIDEISELPLDFQAKLLRALDVKAFTPIGKDSSVKLDCKIIASTMKDTLKMLETNEFRLDLLHRLNTLEITIPPLRERLEDIPILVEFFSRSFARETNKRLPQIKDSFYNRLSEYGFPGNVRELKNIIERIFILFYEPIWSADILDNIDAFKRDRQLRGSLIEHNIKDLDRDRIIEALSKTGGKQKTAAKLLNMSESTLCRKIKKYKIK